MQKFSSKLKLRNNWTYRDHNRWDWEAFIDDYGSGELDQIRFVEYILHPTYPQPIIRSENKSDQFKIKTNGWGIFILKAIVHKLNGEQVTLTHQLELRYEPSQGVSM